ncbi:uncharacterized protein KZ484_021317 [Pholidichthys leucotaenia]
MHCFKAYMCSLVTEEKTSKEPAHVFSPPAAASLELDAPFDAEMIAAAAEMESGSDCQRHPTSCSPNPSLHVSTRIRTSCILSSSSRRGAAPTLQITAAAPELEGVLS